MSKLMTTAEIGAKFGYGTVGWQKAMIERVQAVVFGDNDEQWTAADNAFIDTQTRMQSGADCK